MSCFPSLHTPSSFPPLLPVRRGAGFLPDPEPLGRLPRGFEAWEALADSIPALLAAGQVRAFVHRLPLLDARRLRGEAELRRAYLILAVITQAFVWGVEGDPAQELPASAFPWWMGGVGVGVNADGRSDQ